MNLFLRELRANWKSLLGWSIGMICMVGIGMAKYSVASNIPGQSLGTLVAQMPKSLQAVMGFGVLNLNTASGFFGILFLYLAIMGAIHATNLGSDIVGKEERDRTSEFLFAKPLSRASALTSKLLAALLQIIVLNLVTLGISLVVVSHYAKGESITHVVLVLMAGLFMLQLLFLALGTALSGILPNPKTASSVAMGTMLFTFVLYMAIDLNDKLADLRFITPFKYFDAKNLVPQGRLDPAYVWLSLGLVVIGVAATYLGYQKKDL